MTSAGGGVDHVDTIDSINLWWDLNSQRGLMRFAL
jgi:hypothetical protein